jgi:hypothetical protein
MKRKANKKDSLDIQNCLGAAGKFVTFPKQRTIFTQGDSDLVDQLFNSIEKRLARALLLLARYGKEGQLEPIVGKISQETLAELVGDDAQSRQCFHE